MKRSGKYMSKSEKKGRKILLRALLVILALILLLIAGVIGFVWSKLDLIQYAGESQAADPDEYIEETVDAAESEDGSEDQLADISGLVQFETPPAIPEGKILESDEVINILVLGTDERSKTFSTNARSDSMILVSINKTDKTVKLVSLERGMGVPVLEGEYEGQYDWMTHMFRYGGAELVCKTVEHCFRVEVDNYVRVNFTTVKSVVDAIGGIDIELTAAEAGHLNAVNYANGRFDFCNLQEGMNHLDGIDALGLARTRYIDSDWQRIERQRRVILAAVDALKGSSLKELNNLLDEVLPLIQTDMTMLEIADLMLYSPNFLASAFDQMTIPKEGTYGGMTGMGGRGLFAVDFEINSQILQEFLYGDAASETP